MTPSSAARSPTTLVAIDPERSFDSAIRLQAEKRSRWLWITLADPDPAINGQLLYSKGLIGAASAAGVSLRVIGISRQRVDSRPDPAITWRLGEEKARPAWQRLLFREPAIAQKGLALKGLLAESLRESEWDAIIFDSICAGWALRPVLRHLHGRSSRPKLAYLAHNNERVAAEHIADHSRGIRRLVKDIDAVKVARLEKKLVQASDLLAADSPDDCVQLSQLGQPKRTAFLPPGYGGPRVHARTIDRACPRRALIVGSFDWTPKRTSLEGFLSHGLPMLVNNGIELQIVGATSPAYLADLRQRFPAVDFVGQVEDVRPYMARARVALVPDELGGFKLKGLDYVFNRVPILAMRDALPGMPLRDRHSYALFDTHAGLAAGVAALIDRVDTLDLWQRRAFDACSDRFDWPEIGKLLVRQLKAA